MSTTRADTLLEVIHLMAPDGEAASEHEREILHIISGWREKALLSAQKAPRTAEAEPGTVVVAIIQHFHTQGKRVVELIRVDEDDCDWRTADDNSELAHEWNVVAWRDKNAVLDSFTAPK